VFISDATHKTLGRSFAPLRMTKENCA